MIRKILNPHNARDAWMDAQKVHVPKYPSNTVGGVSLRGFADGLIMGFVFGGVLGILQGWLIDAKTKELWVITSTWALNGAAVGGIVLALGNAITHTDTTPSFYMVR